MTRSTLHLQLARATLAVGIVAMLACTERSATTLLSPTLAASADKGGAPSTPLATFAWEKKTRDLVASHNTSPINAVRIYALHSVAEYAAVVAVGHGNDADGDVDHGGGRALYEARRGAVAGASAQLLSFLMPDAATALEAQLLADGIGAGGETHPQFTRGVAVGRAAGDAMIAWAKTDGFALAWNESMRNAPGVGIWEGAKAVGTAPRPAPAGYQFPTMTPYFLKAIGGNAAQRQFRPDAPPAYSLVAGSPFQVDLGEVKQISLTRTQTQINIANFWNLAGGTPTALGYWDEQAAIFAAAANYDELQASHLFAIVNTAAMDATLGCWEAKYHYLTPRPTMADPTITTVYPLPNHPSYPSGHSCVSSSAATVLASYFPAQASNLNAGVIEAGVSRIYGGIHYRFDITAGQKLGKSTAEWALAYDRQNGLLSAVGLGQ